MMTNIFIRLPFLIPSPHLGACGRAGQSSKALELFQNMRDDGLAADRVAYNALFSALRVSEDADRVSLVWICKAPDGIAQSRFLSAPPWSNIFWFHFAI